MDADYNAAASSAGHRRIRLYGTDVTAGGRKNGPWLAIDSALSFLSRADPTTAIVRSICLTVMIRSPRRCSTVRIRS